MPKAWPPAGALAEPVGAPDSTATNPTHTSRLRPNPSPLLTCRLKPTCLRRYLEVVRQHHSATIAAKKLSVAKRTGKFSIWSDDAARQQVAANRERTVSSSTDLFGTTQLLLDVDMDTRQSCCSFRRIAMIPNHAPEVMVRISVAELI